MRTSEGRNHVPARSPRRCRPLPPSARRTLFAASLGFFVVILDTTIVTLALPAIGDDLGGDLSDLQWVVDGYVVAFAALLLSSGALGDRIGVARGYSAGMALFTVASVACGLAPSLPVLLAARVLQGVGAALLLPNSLALVRLAYHDPGARAKAIATWAAVGGIALAAGPVLGGFLTEAVDWRAIFFVNVPVGIVAIVATSRAPRSPRQRTPLDLPGPGGGDRRRRRAHLRRDRGGRARYRRPGDPDRRGAVRPRRRSPSSRSSAARPTLPSPSTSFARTWSRRRSSAGCCSTSPFTARSSSSASTSRRCSDIRRWSAG